MPNDKEFKDLPPCLIYIDKEGKWYHEGAEIIRPDFIKFFLEHMELDKKGRYIVNWNGQRCYVEVEDTAFVVRQVNFMAENGALERAVIHLNDGTKENLVPETLFVGNQEVLYCRVKDGKFPARFLRPAYYQLTEKIVEEEGKFYLVLGDRKYPIETQMERPGATS
ncbi:MAG: hypothetical protein DRH15_03260 [Deltaproteobacteria bacterium]|nr:MAG: hypothetical protein DRH15_03260 [Deltaproteobacteria bacterium]